MQWTDRIGRIELERVGHHEGDHAGDGPEKLRDQWQDQSVVLVFIRHFG